MNSENIVATVEHDRIDAVEVQERLSWPNAAPASHCDTWLMVNAADLCFKACDKHTVSAMANLGYNLMQEVQAYRPSYRWETSPVEIVGKLAEEIAELRAEAPSVDKLLRWKLSFHSDYAHLVIHEKGPFCYVSDVLRLLETGPTI